MSALFKERCLLMTQGDSCRQSGFRNIVQVFQIFTHVCVCVCVCVRANRSKNVYLVIISYGNTCVPTQPVLTSSAKV